MGIIKINTRRKEGNHEPTPLEDFDFDAEIAHVDCEIIKFRGQTCSVPYALYDLGNLKEVLSLENWNSCLSDEERFYLTAYLPNIDQETFRSTMRELLNGENLFFGSPIDTFFNGLKGGLYSPQVSNYRETLQFIHKRSYYHSLRSYHEKMCQTFENMKKCWKVIPNDASVEERLRIWRNQKIPNPVCPVDLNAMPEDGELSAEVDQDISLLPLSNKTVIGHSDLSASNTKPKGVLKLKSKSRIPEPNSISTPLPVDCLSTKARGVLKIKPMINLQCDPSEPSTLRGFGISDQIGPNGDLRGKKQNRIGLYRKKDRHLSPVKNHRTSDIYPQQNPLTLGLHITSSFSSKTDGPLGKNFGQPQNMAVENGKKVHPLTFKRKMESWQPLKTSAGGDENPMEERKPMKVRLKIWTSPDTRRESGQLNSL